MIKFLDFIIEDFEKLEKYEKVMIFLIMNKLEIMFLENEKEVKNDE